jgi:hypothetical protein
MLSKFLAAFFPLLASRLIANIARSAACLPVDNVRRSRPHQLKHGRK